MPDPTGPTCELFISTDGNDSWSGLRPDPLPDRSDGPFATLERARDAIRERRRAGSLPDGGVTVSLRGGDYPLTGTFHLTEEDSGTEKTRIAYRAFRDEKVRLLGGRILRGLDAIHDLAILTRLDPGARPHVLRCDLRANGITDFGRFTSRGFGRAVSPAHLELFFRGRRMEVARWPNESYTRIRAAAEELPEGDGHGGALGKIEAGFLYDEDRPRGWRTMEGVWMHGFWAWDWADTYEAVASYDPATGLIRALPPHGLYGIKADQRFYFLNVLEELDRPGEYYVDRERGLLYFWPPAPVEDGEAAASVLEEPMVRMEGVRDLSLEGLILEYTRGNGIEISGGARVRVAGCAVRNVGNYAMIVEGGASHEVRSCDVCHTGDGGIQVSGGDRKTLTPSGHLLVNNHIRHTGQWSRCYQSPILMRGVGIRVSNNLIHDSPHNAIMLAGNEHTIERNHIHHVCQDTGDVGAFYMGRDWTERGNVIRHNFFHHTHGPGKGGSMAVYLDDCASGTLVFGNIFYECSRAAFIGGGRDNRVENNVFVACDPAVQVDGRGLNEREVWRNMVHVYMKGLLDAMSPDRPPYAERYPELAALAPFYLRGEGVPPEGNVVTRNISRDGPWLRIHWGADPAMIRVFENLVDEDPRFVDPANLDFQLRDDSPAYALGFQRIPTERIGLFADEYRKRIDPIGPAEPS